MRSLFPGYYRPTEKEFSTLWSEALFVFDTNVLLNLYSYPEDVRNVYLSVLGKLGDRVWIPYHVGLEFHQNRFSKIKQANQRVEKLLQTIKSTSQQLSGEVKAIELEKRNIGVTNIQQRLAAVENAHNELSQAVELACNKLPPISLDDPIGDKIYALFDGRVGNPPETQENLDNLVADGAERFEKNIPPGFADDTKGNEVFRHRGLTYQRKFGDLILWRQIFQYASDNNVTSVVFVTGDRKKDWWWVDDGKTLGPLPALVQEITASTPVRLFWMYSADQFLQNAEVHLKATEVTKEAIAQVKEFSDHYARILDTSRSLLGSFNTESFISAKNHDFLNSLRESGDLSKWESFQTYARDRLSLQNILENNLSTYRSKKTLAGLLDYPQKSSPEDAVCIWLKRTHPECTVTPEREFPGLVVEGQELIRGFEVKHLRDLLPQAFPPSIVNTLLRGYFEVNEGRLTDFSLIVIVPDDNVITFADADWRAELVSRTENLIRKYPAAAIVYGFVNDEIFEPLLTVK